MLAYFSVSHLIAVCPFFFLYADTVKLPLYDYQLYILFTPDSSTSGNTQKVAHVQLNNVGF